MGGVRVVDNRRGVPVLNYHDLKTQQQIRHLLNGLDLCACGTGQNYKILIKMLTRAEEGGSFFDLMDDIPAHAVEFIAHVMCSGTFDLLCHGSSVGHSWPSEKGKLLLRFLTDHGIDSDEWPEWWNCVPVEVDW